MFRNEIEKNEKDEWWFRGKDVVTFGYTKLQRHEECKEAEIFDELKKMGANNMVKWIDKSIGNKSIWCLNVIEIDNSHVTADDFRKQEETKEWNELLALWYTTYLGW